MRQAYRVWSGIASVVFVVVAITDLSSTRSTTTTTSATTVPSTTPSATAGPIPTPAQSATPVAATPAQSGQVVTVTKVFDGDTIEVTGARKVQIIAIDACEPGTYGGDQAAASARSVLEGQSVTLTQAPGVTTDRKGNDLRFVAFSWGGDFGEYAITSEHTTVFIGHRAPKEYLSELRTRDDGPQRCTAPAASYNEDDGGSIDWPSPGDNGLPDGALTGGYCRKKWWC